MFLVLLILTPFTNFWLFIPFVSSVLISMFGCLGDIYWWLKVRNLPTSNYIVKDDGEVAYLYYKKENRP